jgi:hypothetical protein
MTTLATVPINRPAAVLIYDICFGRSSPHCVPSLRSHRQRRAKHTVSTYAACMGSLDITVEVFPCPCAFVNNM